MSKAKIIARHSEQNIMGERNILSKIYHPFIVNMYFSFQDSDNLYLLLDYLSGGDLRYHLSHKKPCVFNEIQTKFFISNIILALEYIHNQKIIHRDIKPENLVLDINGYVRLTDFGIAIINKDDNSKESSGTAGYMAPEVMLQQGHSYPADFFALGVIGYEFMIGNRPYYGKNRKQIKDFIVSYQAKIKFNNMKKGWSENSKDFINKLIQRRPIKRLGYTGIKELKNHLWLKDVDWDSLKKKKIKSPYIPKLGKEYFDKKYCEEEKTTDKYKNLININNYQNIFNNYTFINFNYISKLINMKNNPINNKISNNNELYSLNKPLSFSESFIKVKNFYSAKNKSNTMFKLNKNYYSSSKLNKQNKNNTNINENKKLSSSQSKDCLLFSTNRLRKFYNLGIHREKNNIYDIKESDKEEKNKKYNKLCLSSDNIKKDKTQINLKELHKLIERRIINSSMSKINRVFPNNSINKQSGLINSKSFKSYQSNLKKSITNNIIIEHNQKSLKSPINNEKDILFNSTTKEKTTENKDKINIKKINKKIINNNKVKSIKKEETYKDLDSFYNSQNLFNYPSRNNVIHSRNSRNKIKKQIKSKTKGDSKSNIKINDKTNNKDSNNNNNNNDKNNNNDYHIKVIHKKYYKMKQNINKGIINHNSLYKNNSIIKNKSINKNDSIFKNQSIMNNNSINKNNSIIKHKSLTKINSINNKNYMTINSAHIPKKKSKKIAILKKYKNFDCGKSHKIYNSKGFKEFRKRRIKEKNKNYQYLSNDNLIKDKKDKKNNNNINNENNENNEGKDLKFDDYFKNTGLDKESSKNKYYNILDKFISI